MFGENGTLMILTDAPGAPGPAEFIATANLVLSHIFFGSDGLTAKVLQHERTCEAMAVYEPKQ
jgi:hypothetical protein